MRPFRPGLAAGLAVLALAVGTPLAGPDAPQVPSYDDRFVPVATQAPSPSAIKAPSPIATTSWGVGRVDVFSQSPANTLEQVTYVAGKGWTRAPSLGGSLTSGPAAAATEPGRLHVFARGGDGAVWTRRFEGGKWSGWSTLGGPVLGEPSVVATGPGRLDLFARFGDGTLRHRALRQARWSDWADLGGALTSPPAAATYGGGRLVVFVRSTEDAVWQKSHDGVGWQPFARVGGAATSSPAATSHTDGLVDLYVRGTDGALYHRSLRNGAYSPWTALGGALASGPAATTWGPGHRVVFVLGTNGRVYQRSFAAGRWTGYAPAPVGEVTRSFDEPLAPGVTFRQITDLTIPLSAQVVTIDLTAASTIDTALATEQLAGVEGTSSIAGRHDALVAINGDFALSSGRPVHIHAEDGRLVQGEQTAGRAFAVTRDETTAYAGFPKPVIAVDAPTGRQPIARVNSGAPGFDDVVEYTPEGGELERPSGNGCSVRMRSTSLPRLDVTGAVEQSQQVDTLQCDGNPIPDGAGDILSAVIGGSKEAFIRTLVPGQALTHRWSLAGWPGVYDAVGGNPTLIENGVIMPSVDGTGSFFARNPRTAVGFAPGKVLFAVVDGRQPGHSVGMTLRELANFFLELGARSALNLDGGGSSTMVVNGRIANRPSDGSERGVANALLLLRGADPGEQTAAVPAVRVAQPRAASADFTQRRLLDPASTGGYADMLDRAGVPLSAELSRAAAEFRTR
ncbi:MAG TPA: phosphodiester glycosidase family protein [Mycobacteriales bacterium]|nr:phosphodiester glycosidase family protein [Mycobacteriales bacterium]